MIRLASKLISTYLKVVEDVLTEDSVDFSLCCFRQVRCIHDEDAPVFPDGGADGQRCSYHQHMRYAGDNRRSCVLPVKWIMLVRI